MKAALLSGLVLLGAFAVAAPDFRDHPAPPVAAPVAERPEAPPPLIGNGAASLSIDRSSDNHFYADAQVNGARIRMMIDTGASSVVLTREDAQRAGITLGAYSAKGIGAGGAIRLMPTSIARLATGPLSASNVPAMVAEEGLPVSLLGQSYLARIGSLEIRGDRMVLR